MTTRPPINVWFDREGALLRLRLARPKANILDADMVAALSQALTDHVHGDDAGDDLKALLIEADGPHFSFGASVEEHLPDRCRAMIEGFHALIMKLLALPIPILVAVRGQCLGGGLELACSGSMIFAAPDAQFGQPEIKLAVFAPVASCLLPRKIGPSRADDLLFSGRTIGADEALRMGLVTAVDSEPEATALDYFDRHLAPRSASSLRLAVRAARTFDLADVQRQLGEVEALYLDELMITRDATEGLNAFIEKRPAQWENR